MEGERKGMSIIDEIMVLLDDQEELSLKQIKENLPRRSKQTISSTLGRLCSKQWIKKTKSENDFFYKIDSSGRDEITTNLNVIRQMETDKWDGTWLGVVFNIPEKKRKVRDLFRKSLVDLGLARLFGDLWISFWDHKNSIQDLINELGIDDYSTVFVIQKLSSEDEKNFLAHLEWREKEAHQKYQQFIRESEKYFKTNKNGYVARLLVYEYSKILLNDPKFPKGYEPKNYLGFKAYQIYKKLRPYCYR